MLTVSMRRQEVTTGSVRAGGEKMDCKDCIHKNVCYMRETCNDIEEQIKELGCEDFIVLSDFQMGRRNQSQNIERRG